jgi:hypothetical protein
MSTFNEIDELKALMDEVSEQEEMKQYLRGFNDALEAMRLSIDTLIATLGNPSISIQDKH